jgi:hypothetical protein
MTSETTLILTSRISTGNYKYSTMTRRGKSTAKILTKREKYSELFWLVGKV